MAMNTFSPLQAVGHTNEGRAGLYMLMPLPAEIGVQSIVQMVLLSSELTKLMSGAESFKKKVSSTHR